jgi:hypothetical protein
MSSKAVKLTREPLRETVGQHAILFRICLSRICTRYENYPRGDEDNDHENRDVTQGLQPYSMSI